MTVNLAEHYFAKRVTGIELPTGWETLALSFVACDASAPRCSLLRAAVRRKRSATVVHPMQRRGCCPWREGQGMHLTAPKSLRCLRVQGLQLDLPSRMAEGSTGVRSYALWRKDALDCHCDHQDGGRQISRRSPSDSEDAEVGGAGTEFENKWKQIAAKVRKRSYLVYETECGTKVSAHIVSCCARHSPASQSSLNIANVYGALMLNVCVTFNCDVQFG